MRQGIIPVDAYRLAKTRDGLFVGTEGKFGEACKERQRYTFVSRGLRRSAFRI